MRRVLHNLNEAYHDTPPALLRSVLAGLVVLLAMIAVATQIGCAHTAAGLQREQAAYQVSTNVVAQVHTLVPYVPPPTNYLAEAVLAAVSAGLASWNASQHRRIKQLESKTNGKPPET